MHENPGTLVRVLSISRNSQMLRETLETPLRNFAERPRRVLFAPSSKMLAMSFDDIVYTIYGAGDPYEIEMPDGIILLHIENRQQGLGWNGEEAKLVSLRFEGETVTQIPTRPRPVSSRLGLPRFCPLTGTVFALRTDKDGQPTYFVPILTKRGWQNVETIDIREAIEKARAVWLEN